MSDITAMEAGPLNSTGNRRPATQAARRKRPWPRRARRGIGLPGAVLALVIAAIVLGGTFVLFQGTNTNLRAQTVQTTIGVMEGSIRRSYANLPQYESGLEAGLYGAVPSSAIQGTGSSREIVTPWGGDINAGGGDTPGTNANNANRFWISVKGLPEDACQAIGKSFLNRSDVVGIVVKKNGGSLTRVKTSAQIQAFDTATEIDAECDDDDNAIGIVYRG